MKNILLSVLVATSLVTTLAIANVDRLSAQIVAQGNSTTPKFYCGKTLDPSSKKELPTTLLVSSEVPEPRAMAIWKSEYFGNDFTPQKRCEIVSLKFQTALVDEQRTKIVAAIDKSSGQGIICALATEDEVCDRSKMLYTLKSYQNAQATIDRLVGTVNKSNVSKPIYEGNRRVVVDLKDLLGRK